MGVDVADWVATLKRHPLKFKFEGISKCWESIGEAVTHDERFMDDYMYEEYKGQSECLEKAIEERKDLDEVLSRYCEFLECRVSHKKWVDSGAMTYQWDKAEDEQLMEVIEAVGNSNLQEEYIRDWLVGDTDQYWDMLKDEGQAEYLLKDHPPEAVWSHSYEEPIDFDKVWYLCPSCHREPQIFGERNNSMYCGLCGGESCLDKNETMLDFFRNLDVEVFPFDKDLQAKWEEHFKGYDDVPEEARGVWYAEKLKTWEAHAKAGVS